MSIDVFFIVCDSLQAAILILLEDRCFAFLAVVTASCNTFLFWTTDATESWSFVVRYR
ncbi:MULTISPECIES: hypothetical protein [Paenibacillus]|uniref:hypothetical protein n=1 Tax=Paenibacillus TaxID=44249 RepID=UPI0015C366B6|nr:MULTISPECIES: hypothetical protein [Paenibacillus]MDH6442875.1 hypothetical protein [Paenibacillus sp. PastF-4]